MASRTKKPVRRDAAHVLVPNVFQVPRPIAICPVCWSRPSIEGRRKLQAGSRSTRWNLSVQDYKQGRSSTRVTVLQYPCSNPRCDTIVVVRSPLHEEAEIPSFIKKSLLSKSDTTLYLEHGTGRDGVWKGIVEEPPIEVRVESSPPWILIHAAGLEKEFPKHWTRENGAVKVRGGTAQQEKIWAWFARRGYPLPNQPKKGRGPARTRA